MKEVTLNRDRLYVCRNCLMAIESHEGKQRVLEIDVELDLDDSENVVCDWCGDYSPTLYEIG